jgi:hypothetical protein
MASPCSGGLSDWPYAGRARTPARLGGPSSCVVVCLGPIDNPAAKREMPTLLRSALAAERLSPLLAGPMAWLNAWQGPRWHAPRQVQFAALVNPASARTAAGSWPFSKSCRAALRLSRGPCNFVVIAAPAAAREDPDRPAGQTTERTTAEVNPATCRSPGRRFLPRNGGRTTGQCPAARSRGEAVFSPCWATRAPGSAS